MYIRNEVEIPPYVIGPNSKTNSDEYTQLTHSISQNYTYIRKFTMDGITYIIIEGKTDNQAFVMPKEIFDLCFVNKPSSRALICNHTENQEVYISMGHVAEVYDIQYKTLPEDCIYLSLALCGTETNEDTVKRIYELFTSKSKMIKYPCSYFRELNDYLTVSLHNPEYNDKTHPDKITPDKLYTNDDSTYLNIHYNDPEQKLNKYLDAEYYPFGNYVNGNDSTHPYPSISLWKSGLYKMSSLPTDFDSEIVIYNYNNDHDTYFNRFMFHVFDIYFLFDESIRPTVNDIFNSIDTFKKSYYESHNNVILDDNSSHTIKIINDFYFSQYINKDIPLPTTYSRVETHRSFTFKPKVVSLRFAPSISIVDFFTIIGKWTIFQSELFKLYTGIHYNINCRAHRDAATVEPLKAASTENKRKVFENIYIAEEDKRALETTKQTAKFKRGVKHGDLLAHTRFALNVAEKKGSSKFVNAEKYGHKLLRRSNKTKGLGINAPTATTKKKGIKQIKRKTKSNKSNKTKRK